MRRCILLAVLVLLAAAAPASAQATRTWVSGVGDDVNPCSRTAPCKTFAGAISKTAVGGEIDALDPGGYGTVTITKSITIDGGGTHASILASGVNGVVVNIPEGSANDPERRVVLRDLSINGTGSTGAVGESTGISGVRIDAARAVHVEHTRIGAFTKTGIDFTPTAAGAASLLLDDVTIAEVDGNGLVAGAAPGGAALSVLVRDSAISGARGTDGGPAGETGIGVAADSGATVALTRTSVFDNVVGLKALARNGAAGVIQSWCDNQVGGNADDGAAPVALCPAPPTQTVVVPGDPVVVKEPVQRCAVPDLKGLTAATAKRVLAAAGCSLGTVKRRKAVKRRRGKVLAQSTAAGTALERGAAIAVTVGRR